MKPSDRPASERLTSVGDAIRAGNWDAAELMARRLSGCALPVTQPELESYLNELRQTVIVAKASRSVAVATLVRVQAAARFQSDTFQKTPRQNFADSADFSHPPASLQPASSIT